MAYAIATGVGAGLSHFAPGTLGAIEGVAVYFAAISLVSKLVSLTLYGQIGFLIALNVILFALGVWASQRTCKISGLKDPQNAVIDEVSGQLISLTPLAFSPSIGGVILAFALFRLFDIFKPWPIRKLERLPGGFGVMADDALAGLYAGLLVCIGRLLNLF